MNEADYICQRIHKGWYHPGDFIRLISLTERGVNPEYYNFFPTSLMVTIKKQPQ